MTTKVSTRVRRTTTVEETIDVELPLFTRYDFIPDGPGDTRTTLTRVGASGGVVQVTKVDGWNGGKSYEIEIGSINLEIELGGYLPKRDGWDPDPNNQSEFEETLAAARAALAKGLDE